jgi:hypothetical protein
MKTLSPYKSREPGWEPGHELGGEAAELPGRPRRQFLNWRSATLMALIVGAIGFYVGIRVEKGQAGRSSSAARGLSFPTALGGAGAGGAGGGTFGTVSSVSGKYLYVTDSSGNTIKVELSSATKVSKSVNVSKRSVRPGDTVVIGGLTSSKGTVVATSVRDSGASGAAGAGAGGAGSGGGSGSGTTGSAAVKSLFGNG